MPVTPDSIDYSIVICTYNPDERILKRCLDAVLNLEIEGITTEVILVDNNSLTPVDSLFYIREYVSKIPRMKTILVVKQGVKYARMAAIEKSKGTYIVYFDYDNEPAGDYLQELKKLNDQHPQVGAIGPGNVTVDFIDGIDKKIESYARIAFQERHEEALKVAALNEWQPFYPFGTGLCTKSILLKEYAQLAQEGKFTMTGRKGYELSSGEDTQMVLYCINQGYFAGVAPALKLNHIIPANRANNKYLQQLLYGTFVCYETSLLQVFPLERERVKNKVIAAAKFSRQAIKKYISAKISFDPHKFFDLIYFIAVNAGVYKALGKPLPKLVTRIINSLKLN